MRQALHGESLSSPQPAVPEFDPYRWLALNLLRATLSPPVHAVTLKKAALARWAQSRVAWLKSDSGRFWVAVADQSWEEMYSRTLSMCQRLQAQWKAPEPASGGAVVAQGVKAKTETAEEVKARRRRSILLLKSQGRTLGQISITLGISRREVFRVLKGK